jgi:hypothetical protein
MLTSRSTVNLTTLLPSTSYVLSYALPLLLLSILLTFAGTFLTLDRTHSFAPQYDSLPGGYDNRTKKNVHWILEGGIGGLACGFHFGRTFAFLHVIKFGHTHLPSSSLYLPCVTHPKYIVICPAISKCFPTSVDTTHSHSDVGWRALEILCPCICRLLRRVSNFFTSRSFS